jgi:hypothetical protein
MTHLGSDELIDAMDGALDSARRGHLDVCEQCRAEASALRALMADVRASEVPEPSPLFWDRFSARVREAIDEDTPARAPRWFEWPVFAPLAALGLVVLALVSAVPLGDNAGAPSDSTIASTNPASATTTLDADVVDIESQWALVADMIGELDVDAAHEAGIASRPGTADFAVLELSSGEREELIRLLKQELRVGG